VKRVGQSRYVHRSALGELDKSDRRRVEQAARLFGAWDVARVDADGRVMLGRTTSWSDPHPVLLESMTFGRGAPRHRTYGDSPPIYHRCEQMLSSRHPAHQRHAALSAAEERAGLLSRSDIGTKGAWERVLEQQGYRIEGFDLMKRQGSRMVNLDALIAKAARERSGTDLLDDAIARIAGRSSSSDDPLDRFNALWESHTGSKPQRKRVGTRLEWRHTVDDLGPRARQQIWDFVPDLRWYDFIILNSSAGKDSMAAMIKTIPLAERAGVLDRVWIVHCDLGKAEHPGTRQLAQQHARELGLPLQVIDTETTRGRSLMERFEDRLSKGGGFPGFGTRYCTSEYKTGEVNKLITAFIEDRFGRGNLKARMGRRARILNVLGLRAEESDKRKQPPLRVKKENATRKVIHEWLPVQGWTEAQVWKAIEQSNLRPHPFYAKGGRRLSCRFCPLAADEDIRLAGRLYPDLAEQYMQLQQRYDAPFKQRKRLSEILGIPRKK
jgi:3'-phosphoadenosine 5'-phosphosulfate sulfotransferase (PAPS reductase)/FAD synthetase